MDETRLPDDPRLAGFIDNARRRLVGEPELLRDNIIDRTDPEYMAQLSTERAHDAGDDDREPDEPAEPYTEQDLANTSTWAAEQMGFGQRVGPGTTAQDAWFEGMPEKDRAAAFAAWHGALTPEEQAAVDRDPELEVAAFADWLESSPANRLQATAAAIPGAKIAGDPFHRPLNRFRR